MRLRLARALFMRVGELSPDLNGAAFVHRRCVICDQTFALDPQESER